MDRFDDVSVVASVDESPPAPRTGRGARRAFTGAVAVVVATGALAGAAVGLADEKAEPSPSSAAPAGSHFFSGGKRDGRECRKGERHRRSQSSTSLRY